MTAELEFVDALSMKLLVDTRVGHMLFAKAGKDVVVASSILPANLSNSSSSHGSALALALRR